MQRFLIKTDRATSRLDYICAILFTNFFGMPFRISTKDDEQPDEIIVNYFEEDQIRDGINIPKYGLLEERGILPHSIEVKVINGLPCFFCGNEEDLDIPFDLFSMCFYLITRYEEYFSKDLDQYGRFKSTNSLAVKHDFIHIPLIDLWMKWFIGLIQEQYNIPLKFSGAYRKLVTFDIDLPYAFKGKKDWKVIGGLIKDLAGLRGHTIGSRLNYILKGADPFDTYDWIKSQCAGQTSEIIFFILNRYNPPLDENHLANTPELKSIIKSLQEWAAIGIHPSLTAGGDPYKILEEKAYVAKHLEQPVFKSRQHYLHLKMPGTYRALIASGMEQDYSMGYPECSGFRASTARPFLWYDLMNECITDLTIYPCMTMDATMRYYEELSPELAKQKCKELMLVCQEVSGTFSFIWHNSSLSKAYGWGPWKSVFTTLVNH